MKAKYTTIFSSYIRPVVSEERDKYLSLASMVELEDFVPNVDLDKNYDLLPIAFNAFVVNRVNKNGDVVDTETALAMYKDFINKPINIEHNRQNVIGTILTAGFSEFGTDKPLEESEVAKMTGPFNVVLGGVVWKVTNRELADKIEASGDPSSEDYMKISASWELGFTDYNLVAIEGDEKNIEAALEIDNLEQIQQLQSNLKAFGGNGKLEDGRNVYRKVVNDVLPLGIGITDTPAADVQGISIKKPSQDIALKDSKSSSEESLETPEETSNLEIKNISQSKEKDVTENKPLIEGTNIMKINSIKDITDENLKELSASVISDFIEEQLKSASEDYHSKQNETQNRLNETEEKYNSLEAKFDELSKEKEGLSESLESIKQDYESLLAAKAEKEKQELFDERMAAFDSEYDLEEEHRSVIAKQIIDLDEEAFANAKESLSILLRDRVRKTEEAAASEVEPQKAEEVVAEAVENAKVIEDAAASTDPAQTENLTVREKYANAFSLDQFTFKN
tara:strand:+ start:2948 stop:4474 length:1527 start_codon:yes stop_codon:yes gene_type:complete